MLPSIDEFRPFIYQTVELIDGLITWLLMNQLISPFLPSLSPLLSTAISYHAILVITRVMINVG